MLTYWLCAFIRTLVVQKPTTQRAIEATLPQTDYEHARNRLHVKAVPDTLPCREDEFAEIQDQLRYAIEDGTGSCICRCWTILTSTKALDAYFLTLFITFIRHLWRTRDRKNSYSASSHPSIETGG